MKVNNGVVLFDEIDKVESKTVVNALLQITDNTQNNEFRDVFLHEITHDISNLWFIYAINDDSSMNRTLKDRLYPIIEIEPYKPSELIIIQQKFVLPKIIKDKKMPEMQLSKEVCEYIINYVSSSTNTGLRHIQSIISEIVSKLHLISVLKEKQYGFASLKYDHSKITFPFMIDMNCFRCLFDDTKQSQPFYIS
jgi:ATP-dependent Lon protease